MIVVTTPTGQIGSKVVQDLLAAGKSVRVIQRDPAKLAPDVREKAEVIQGSTDDESVLMQALDGAESLFWLVPPSFQASSAKEYYLQFTRPACRAIQAKNVKRVVAVSALGHDTAMANHAGLASAAFASDDAIKETGADFRALWCPGFMENMLLQTDSLKNKGTFFGTMPPDLKVPLAATQDIAANGAKLLLNTSWAGQGGLAVLGPEDLSQHDMAAILTDVLNKPIRFQQVSLEDTKNQLMEMGASEGFAQDYIDMFAAKGSGLDNATPRTPENTTPTTFRQWCEDVLKPAVLG